MKNVICDGVCKTLEADSQYFNRQKFMDKVDNVLLFLREED